jgi:hypothetical protein
LRGKRYEKGGSRELKPAWISKTDPEHYPVRFLAFIWQQRLANNPRVGGMCWTGKQYGQLKKLREALGDFTQHVVEWMLIPENWWRFSQQVRTEGKLYRVPPDPNLGFLLAHRNRALKIMRWALHESTAPADVTFVQKLDQLRFAQMKSLVLVYADGVPEYLIKVEASKTLTDIQKLFIEIIDDNTPASQ